MCVRAGQCELEPHKDEYNPDNLYGSAFRVILCCKCWGIYHRESVGLPDYVCLSLLLF